MRDLQGYSGSGVPIAAMAGPSSALVAGFGGLRTAGDADGGTLAFAPRLPAALTRLAVNLCYRCGVSA